MTAEHPNAEQIVKTIDSVMAIASTIVLAAGDEIGDEMSVVQETLFALSVCMPKGADLDMAQLVVREQRAAGTGRGWALARGTPDFIVECADDPQRQHVLFLC